ncbi:MAG TPA: DUF4097 family beta strand repeat-containing protein [Streptosporangiaceae bacterium]|nr:DUF4097 family beta strand repeat-containing protein [Streptosporangiaceae bacterium]
MTNWEFPCTTPVDVRVSTASGSVTIIAADTQQVTVVVHPTWPDPQAGLGQAEGTPDAEGRSDNVRVSFAAGRLEVSEPVRLGLHRRQRDLHLVIGVPQRSSCTVRTASADISCQGELGSLDASSAAGAITAEAVHGPARLAAMSGQAQIGYVAGEVTANTASGDIELGRIASDVAAKTVSGDIRIAQAQAQASVTARTASGRVWVGNMVSGRADVNTVSGDIDVKVAPGTGVYLDLASVTGRMNSELDPSDQRAGTADLHVTCRTVSGSVYVAKARPGAADAVA